MTQVFTITDYEKAKILHYEYGEFLERFWKPFCELNEEDQKLIAMLLDRLVKWSKRK